MPRATSVPSASVTATTHDSEDESLPRKRVARPLVSTRGSYSFGRPIAFAEAASAPSRA